MAYYQFSGELVLFTAKGSKLPWLRKYHSILCVWMNSKFLASFKYKSVCTLEPHTHTHINTHTHTHTQYIYIVMVEHQLIIQSLRVPIQPLLAPEERK